MAGLWKGRLREWVAESVDSGLNFLCCASNHVNGCWFIGNRLGMWAVDVLGEERYPDKQDGHNGCRVCGRKWGGMQPNPYYSSEKELAEWARWFTSDVTPEDFEEFWQEQVARGQAPYDPGKHN